MAWVVTPIVLITTYLFGQKVLKMPSKTLNITISSDMSVCGVSAAIATAAACRAKKEELTLAVGLSLIFTSIMMIAMPAFIKAVGMPEILGGAWMGGTIDATGAVAAAGEFLGEEALYVAATIKMIQNVLIGVIAFCVATYWCLKVDREAGRQVGAMEIWYRFPKFVLGFIGVSIVFSIIYAQMGPDVGYTMIDNGVIRGLTKNLRGWFFCLAFVSIGLATDFRELKHHFKGGKPLILYVCGQTLQPLPHAADGLHHVLHRVPSDHGGDLRCGPSTRCQPSDRKWKGRQPSDSQPAPSSGSSDASAPGIVQRWVRFLAGVLVILVFAFVVLPAVQRLGPIRDVHEAIERSGIDATALVLLGERRVVRGRIVHPQRAEIPGVPGR